MAAPPRGTQAPHLHCPAKSAAFPSACFVPTLSVWSQAPGALPFKVIFQVRIKCANQAICVTLAAGTRVNKSFRHQLCAVSDMVADLSTIVDIPLLLERPSRVVTSQQLQWMYFFQPGLVLE